MGGQTQNFLPQYGLQSERLLWPTKGPGAFEQEVAALERTLGLTNMGKGPRMGADELDVASEFRPFPAARSR
jgi:hypothetical protein